MKLKYLYISIVAIILILIIWFSINLISGKSNSNVLNPFAGTVGYNNYSEGVVSYGLTNSLGILSSSGKRMPYYNMSTYQVVTNAIFGCVNISSIQVYTPDSPPNASIYGAGLQLNVNLVINSTNGHSYTYWLQNTIAFNTSSRKYTIADSIYNMSSPYNPEISQRTLSGNGDMKKQEIYKNGKFSYMNITDATYPLYEYDMNGTIYDKFTNNTHVVVVVYMYFKNYTLPMTYCPVIHINNSGNYPVVNFGYEMNDYKNFYDNVTFLIPDTSSYLFVTPYKYTPSNNTYYDAEFVFGGGSYGQNATFTNLNATDMWLFYYSNGTFVPFPSLYSSGWDTGEHAINLQVSQGSNYASVTAGAESLFSNMTLPSSKYNSTEYSNVASWIEGK